MVLQFDVINQRVVRKDHNYVVANSQNYLEIDFNFTYDWSGLEKVIYFSNGLLKKKLYLDEYDSCKVPVEMIKVPSFSFSLKGESEDVIITTRRIEVAVNPSGEIRLEHQDDTTE